MRILVTGGAGFIGSHLIDALLKQGDEVISVDNFDPFYARSIKEQNMQAHLKSPACTFIEEDILNTEKIAVKLQDRQPDVIVHLAAKAGVRPSIEDPLAYQRVNVQGTLQMLELARKLSVKKFIFASSSSVYGENPNVPWKESDKDLMPISPYASSKIAAESFGRIYSHLHGMDFTALRFFTVYGPRQRPDLAIHKFFKQVAEGRAIPVFGDGSTSRDYTYIDDIVNGIMGAVKMQFSASAFRVYNLGNSDTVKLGELITAIEEITGMKAIIDRKGEQPGDVTRTFADISKARRELGFNPSTGIKKGLQEFYNWYKTISLQQQTQGR